jgi:hypothetical protein
MHYIMTLMAFAVTILPHLSTIGTVTITYLSLMKGISTDVSQSEIKK